MHIKIDYSDSKTRQYQSGHGIKTFESVTKTFCSHTKLSYIKGLFTRAARALFLSHHRASLQFWPRRFPCVRVCLTTNDLTAQSLFSLWQEIHNATVFSIVFLPHNSKWNSAITSARPSCLWHLTESCFTIVLCCQLTMLFFVTYLNGEWSGWVLLLQLYRNAITRELPVRWLSLGTPSLRSSTIFFLLKLVKIPPRVLKNSQVLN